MSSDTVADIDASVINSVLNSVILFIFLIGMYTVIYFGTIYLYCTKNSPKHPLVPVSITILYLSIIGETALQWYATKWEFVNNGETQQSVIFAILDSPEWMYLASNTLNCISFVVADGLLIWRCFYAWNRSLRIILVPLLLIVAEFVLFLTQTSLHAKYNNLNVSAAVAARINDILSAAFFMSFATTLVTTILIAYRIYSVSKNQGVFSRRFKNIIDIVVQSGAVYALSQLVVALAGVVPGANTFTKGSIAFDAYAQVLNFAIAGISATVMVARVALLSADATYPTTSVHLSGLQFHVQSAGISETMEITHASNGNKFSPGEGQAAEEKV